MNIIFTVCNRLQLPNALALGASVLQFHPDSLFYIGWADTFPLPKVQNGIKAIPIEDIDVPEWGQMCSTYFDFEIVAASRPWFAKGILKKQKDCKQLTFLAPTTLLFSSIQEITHNTAELLLTPHIIKPLGKSNMLDDKRILNIGMFHSGSWVIKPGEATYKLLDWWSHRTIDRAKFDLCNGMCMDQLWLNYAPVWVKNTIQVQHAGWHYGLHSVLNKNLKEENGSFFIDDEKLISIDFAGLGNYHPVWSEHIGLVNQNSIFKRLFDQYQHSLKKYESLKISGEPAFGKPSNISSQRALRKNIAGRLKAITKFVDRF